MGKTKHIEIDDCLSGGLLKAFKVFASGASGGFVHVEDEDNELSLFEDTDGLLGRGEGYFRFDEAECDSRRLDMNTDLDRDPGPFEMEEAPEGHVPDVLIDLTPGPAPVRRSFHVSRATLP